MYDIIGDIHGHAAQLTALLVKLGYVPDGDVWRHETGQRRLVFAGDYIDRGPDIKKVLKIVRACVDHADAVAIMGNHEFNAIAYETTVTGRGEGAQAWCKPHTEKNTHQYEATLAQLSDDDERSYWIDWFRTLPPTWSAEGIRVVHACWNPDAIPRIYHKLNGHGWTDELIREATNKTTQLYQDHELVFKGLEITLPDGRSLKDKAGVARTEARVQWWREPSPDEPFGDWMMPPSAKVRELVGDVFLNGVSIPLLDDPITCIGHYWMPTQDKPQPIHDKVVCVDYSVAKGGYMCAYRFDGEDVADSEKMVWVE